MKPESDGLNRRKFLGLATAGILAANMPRAIAEPNATETIKDIEKLSDEGRVVIQEAKQLLSSWIPTDWIAETYTEPWEDEHLPVIFAGRTNEFPTIEQLVGTVGNIVRATTDFTNSTQTFFGLLRDGKTETATASLNIMREAVVHLRAVLTEAESTPDIHRFLDRVTGRTSGHGKA